MEYEPKTLQRYRTAVEMKSRAEERRRTAVQHIDTYECIYALKYWTKELKEAYAALQVIPISLAKIQD